MKVTRLVVSILAAAVLFTAYPIISSAGFVRGIYVTQTTAESKKNFDHLIKQSKATGISTFVIDIWGPSKRYERAIKTMHENGIKYIARVVIFPGGGTLAQVRDRSILEKRWKLVNYALQLGASDIQLDYIRYTHKMKASERNVEDIHSVIRWFRDKMKSTNSSAKLQIDVFGIASFGPSKHIGQDLALFAGTVDAINPMVYPSHYEPFMYHAVRPYETVLKSISLVRKHIQEHEKVAVNAYVELSNYRYPMSHTARLNYIKAQLKAAYQGGAQGWYAWSPQNKYNILFEALRNYKESNS